MTRRHVRTLLAAAVATTLPSVAVAGGIARPTPFSARAFGLGGAFSAVADDPTALHYNPAGLALQPRASVLAGMTVVRVPRTYRPLTPEGELGPGQSDVSAPAFIPVMGYVTRFEEHGVPSRFAFGVGLWNSYGGSAEYEKGPPDQAALDKFTLLLFELVPGVAYEVNDVLTLGVAGRLGLGIFSIEQTARPSDASFTTIGLGGGFTAGIMIRPHERLQLGATYRSPITIPSQGEGELALGGGDPQTTQVRHTQDWPQSMGVGAAVRVTSALRLSLQFDWADWSVADRFVVEFGELIQGPAAETVAAERPLDLTDAYTYRAGLEAAVTPTTTVRAGYYFDANTFPDRTLGRQSLAGPKHGLAIGGGYVLGKRWVFDAAFEALVGPRRMVEDNRMEYSEANWATRANAAPGEHKSAAFQLELNTQYRF